MTSLTESFSIISTTSSDPAHPLSNVLNDSEDSFFMSTGLYPQEFILATKDAAVFKLSKIKLLSCNIRALEISVSSKTQPVNFDKIVDIELEDHDRQKMQVETFNLDALNCRFLKVKVSSGYEDFFSLHTIHLIGEHVE